MVEGYGRGHAAAPHTSRFTVCIWEVRTKKGIPKAAAILIGNSSLVTTQHSASQAE